METSDRRCSSQFHQAIVSRCCQICGEYQQAGPLDSTLLADTELNKVFPSLTARGASGRPSRLTCPACSLKICKFRSDCVTNLLAAKTVTKEERQAVIAATRYAENPKTILKNLLNWILFQRLQPAARLPISVSSSFGNLRVLPKIWGMRAKTVNTSGMFLFWNNVNFLFAKLYILHLFARGRQLLAAFLCSPRLSSDCLIWKSF